MRPRLGLFVPALRSMRRSISCRRSSPRCRSLSLMSVSSKGLCRTCAPISEAVRRWSDAGRRCMPLLIPCGCCLVDRVTRHRKSRIITGISRRPEIAHKIGARPPTLSSIQWRVIFPAIPPVCRWCKTPFETRRRQIRQPPSRGFAQPSEGRPKQAWKYPAVPSSRRTACPSVPLSSGGV